MDYEILKPSRIMRMRSSGEISGLEFTAISNMLGRCSGLKAMLGEDSGIYFRNGGKEPVVEIKRDEPKAIVYTSGCHCPVQADQFCSGLSAAGYDVEKRC